MMAKKSTKEDDSIILSKEVGSPLLEGNDWVNLSSDGYVCISLWKIGIKIDYHYKSDLIVFIFFFSPLYYLPIKKQSCK